MPTDAARLLVVIPPNAILGTNEYGHTTINDIVIDSGWRQRTEYSFYHKGRQINKEVYWYIATTNQLNVTISHEHTNYLWLNFDEAETQLTFDQEKALLRDARTYLAASGATV